MDNRYEAGGCFYAVGALEKVLRKIENKGWGVESIIKTKELQ